MYVSEKTLLEFKKLTEVGLKSTILYGLKGVGKSTFMREYVQSLISKGLVHPYDVLVVEEEKISKETVIEILNKCSQAPLLRYRIITFEHAEGLNKFSANALLKEIEDSGFNIFFFLTNKVLLDTIESRCLKVNFPKIPKNHLKNILTKENPFMAEPDIEIISILSQGCYGIAKKLIDKEDLIMSVKKYISANTEYDRLQAFGLMTDDNTAEEYLSEIQSFLQSYHRVYRKIENKKDLFRYISDMCH